jgi:hypothetical protein
MKKVFHIVLKILLTLLLIMPVLGPLNLFPAPTADMYTNPLAFDFIKALMSSYIIAGMSITCLLTLICLWSRREALAALLVLPVTANIIGFHAFLDGGLFTAGAIMGNALLLINIYFLWVYRTQYQTILTARKK